MLLLASCTQLANKQQDTTFAADTSSQDTAYQPDTSHPLYINTGNTNPQEVVAFAQRFTGTPYVYASTNPAKGFDCSGFITHVFNHFNITVPRTSAGFTDVPREIPVSAAKPADLILFTGTDSTVPVVGHMGIVVYNENDSLAFIHASSGKANGVTTTPLNDYYRSRFVKVIRVFRQGTQASL